MTPLRKRMTEDLQLKGYSERTQQMYVRAVRQLAQHYNKSPDKITEEDLRDYFLYGKNIKKWSRTTSTIALCSIKFFYENTSHALSSTLSSCAAFAAHELLSRWAASREHPSNYLLPQIPLSATASLPTSRLAL